MLKNEFTTSDAGKKKSREKYLFTSMDVCVFHIHTRGSKSHAILSKNSHHQTIVGNYADLLNCTLHPLLPHNKTHSYTLYQVAVAMSVHAKNNP